VARTSTSQIEDELATSGSFNLAIDTRALCGQIGDNCLADRVVRLLISGDVILGLHPQVFIPIVDLAHDRFNYFVDSLTELFPLEK
jgi:hypothetical protein